jgi:hypothetical protein
VWPTAANYLIAGLLGGLLGAAELLSRYRDKPSLLLRVPATWAYVLVNFAAALAAFLVIQRFGWDFGQSAGALVATQVLVAGLGSAALFRSSLFMVKVGVDTVGVGPNVVLASLLDAADRAVDRAQAERRLATVTRVMAEFDFEAGHNDLVTACLGAAANVSSADALSLRDSVTALAGSDATTAKGKNLTLGLLIIDVVGAEVLEAAVTSLR